FLYTLWILKFIRFNINKIRPDSILSFCERYNNLVLLALKGTSHKVYVSDRNNPNNNIGLFHEYLRQKLYKSADGIIAQTLTSLDILRRKTKNNNIIAIPNPLRDLIDYNVPKENIIINVGRLESQKNQKDLIEIFSKLQDANDWSLKIFGEGSLKKELLDLISSLNLNSRVEVMEFQENI